MSRREKAKKAARTCLEVVLSSMALSLAIGELSYWYLRDHDRALFPTVLRWRSMDGGSESWGGPGFVVVKVRTIVGGERPRGATPDTFPTTTFEIGRKIQYCALLDVGRIWGSTLGRREVRVVILHSPGDPALLGSEKPSRVEAPEKLEPLEEALPYVFIVLQTLAIFLLLHAAGAVWHVVARRKGITRPV